LGTAPNRCSSCHQPANRSSLSRLGISNAPAVREYPDTVVITGSCFAVRDWPNPTGSSIGGNQKSNWASSPGSYAVRPDGSGGRYTGRSSATRPESTRIERVQPIRSAITVAGILG
jgi:hypothetical protein